MRDTYAREMMDAASAQTTEIKLGNKPQQEGITTKPG